MELKCTFLPTGGGPPRAITLRISDPERGPHSWISLVEILGFDMPHSIPVHGEDWAQAVELAAAGLPHALSLLVRSAGGGTLDPSFYEREAPG